MMLLRQATKAVPAVAYATGLVGIAAAIVIVRALLGDVSFEKMLPLLLGSIFCMAVLVVFAAAAEGSKRKKQPIAMAFLWAACIFMIFFMGFTVTAVGFGWPAAWARLILPDDINNGSTLPPATSNILETGSSVPLEEHISRTETVKGMGTTVTVPERTTVTIEPHPVAVRQDSEDSLSVNRDFERPEGTITINNSSSQTIQFIYVSSPNSSSWEEDLLGENVLHSSSLAPISINNSGGCVRDIRIVLADGTELSSRFNSCAVKELRVDDQGIEEVT